LWHFRLIFIPAVLPKQPDSISLEQRAPPEQFRFTGSNEECPVRRADHFCSILTRFGIYRHVLKVALSKNFLQWKSLRYERTDEQNNREKDGRMDMTRLIVALDHYKETLKNRKAVS